MPELPEVETVRRAIAPVLEGARPLCVEIQALVVETPAPVPRRVAQAVDGNRLAMLLAVTSSITW